MDRENVAVKRESIHCATKRKLKYVLHSKTHNNVPTKTDCTISGVRYLCTKNTKIWESPFRTICLLKWFQRQT